ASGGVAGPAAMAACAPRSAGKRLMMAAECGRFCMFYFFTTDSVSFRRVWRRVLDDAAGHDKGRGFASDQLYRMYGPLWLVVTLRHSGWSLGFRPSAIPLADLVRGTADPVRMRR